MHQIRDSSTGIDKSRACVHDVLEIKNLQIAVFRYFLTITLKNILFHFPEYVKQLKLGVH